MTEASTLVADYAALPLSDLEALAEIYALADDPASERQAVINQVIAIKTEGARWKRYSRQHEQHSRDNREAAKSYAVFLEDLEQVDSNRGAIFKYLRGYLIPAQQLATVNLLDFIEEGRVDYQALDDYLHRHAIEVGA